MTLTPNELLSMVAKLNERPMPNMQEENWEELESDDGHRDLYDDDFDVSFDDMVDSFTQFDDQRDLDYYES